MIRLPLQTVETFTDADDTGTGSVNGGIPHVFRLPQDCDNALLKFTASVAGCGVSAVVQTTDDGGTTYYDVARTSIVSDGAIPQWLNIPISGPGLRSAVQGQNSVAGATNVAVALNTIGNTAASSLGQSQVSGLPMLSQTGRVFIVIDGDVTSAASNSITSKIIVNHQASGN